MISEEGRRRLSEMRKKSRREIKFEINNNGCFECMSHKDSGNGYLYTTVDRKKIALHRLAYEQKKGKIPNGAVIRHTCDNKICINPEHLIAGTHADNVRDRQERGRQARGEKHRSAILTETQVKEIKTSKKRSCELAKEYKVSQCTISDIKHNRHWKYLFEKR